MGYANSNYHRLTGLGSSNGGGLATAFPVDLDFLASGQRMLANTPSGIVYADRLEVTHAQTVLGFTKTAGSVGVLVVSEGYYVDGTMAWDPELPLWLDEDGLITQVRPTTGFLMQVGRVITPTEILIQIQPAVILA